MFTTNFLRCTASHLCTGSGRLSDVLMDDRRAIKALAHPTRVQVLRHLEGVEMASPHAMADQFGIPLGTLSYHVRRLHALGCIELVRRVPRRGALENFYGLKRGVEVEETFRTMGRELLGPTTKAKHRDQVLLDARAIAALRPSVARLMREMRELEAATVRRTALGGDGSSFTVDVLFVVDGAEQRMVPLSACRGDGRRE
jgi:DNA-binding transcriptional ArsR family regulator